MSSSHSSPAPNETSSAHSNGRLVFIVVHQNDEVRAALVSTLARRYGVDFDLEAAGTWPAGTELLAKLRADRRVVPLIITDHWPDPVRGMAFVDEARRSHPTAKTMFVMGPGSREQEGLQRAMALGHIDGWLTQPWDPPDRLLFPAVAELLEEWFEEISPYSVAAITVIGDRSSPRSFEFRDVLRRNDIPNRFVDADSDEGQRLLRELGQPADRLPVVVLQDGQILVQPKNDEVAQALGVRTGPHSNLYDLAVVGAGPAGLSAAVYGASEGLRTAIVEREAFGGQAGTSSRIRNYLGFPRGVSGLRLGRHATQQAILFGADTIYGEAVSLESFDNRHRLTLRNGNRMEARSVVIATGVTYRRLGVPSVERLVGAGVFYGAAISEALAMRGEEVFIIGGGNSAGQAAVYLARFAKHVTLLARGQTLAASMSDYLVRLLESLNNVEIRLRTRVVDGIGAARLEGLKLATDELPVEERPAGALFILIGTRPHTEWLRPSIQTDEAGFIVTGPGAMKGSYRSGREPYAYETSNAGVFAVGDVRASSIKRVASAVGEGSVATSQVHAYLEQSHKALT